MDQTTVQTPFTPPNENVPPVSSPQMPPQFVSPPPSNVVVGPPQSSKKSPSGKNGIIIGVSVLVLGALVFGISKFTGLLSKATGSESCLPVSVREDQVTANSATIVFQTANACQVEIAYGTSSQAEALLLQVPEEAMASLNHNVKLSPLLPSTTYYYQIKVDGKPVGTVHNFLTAVANGTGGQKNENNVPIIVPTTSPLMPTQKPTKAVYSIEDFQAEFGGKNPVFDIDKNGIVNFGDWSAYQKTLK